MNQRYDAIIIGSGPAGSTAAYFLGAQGRKTLVLEKQSLPRYKTCGGGLSLQMLRIFPFSFDPVVEIQVKKTTYQIAGQSVTFELPPQSIGMVMRDRFDAFILEHSRAEVRTGQQVMAIRESADHVTVETRSGQQFETDFLIGADGANSLAAHSINPGSAGRNVAAIEIEARVAPKIQEKYAENPLFIFDAIPYGYLWIFPKRDHLSVGIAAYHPRPGQLQSILRQEMGRIGITWEDHLQHGHPIPVYTRRKKIASSRILLAGDAAGLVDPFTGEGIRFAISSGRLAAQAILQSDLKGYPSWVDRQIGNSHRLGLGLARLFYRFPELCFELGVKNPRATEAFSRMLAGDWGYSQVLLRLFGTLPIHILQQTLDTLHPSARIKAS